MDFALSPEHEEFRRVVRTFAATAIAPHSERWDAEHHFPVEAVKAMGELGLFGLPFPESYGGSDADFLTFCIAVEEIARVDSSLAITLEAAVGLGANPIFAFGTEEQKQRWLPDLLAGRALAAFALTEPDAGSDAAATRTRAVRDGDEWVIDGTKAFITNSGTPITTLITVTARTSEDGISTIVVPAGTPGLVVEPAYRKMGWRASDTHGLRLESCRVPSDHLLGESGRGLQQFLSILDDGRIAIAAMSLGVATACLEQSLDYALNRSAFGRPIGANQAVAFKIADIQVAVEAARLLTYRAAWLRDTGRPFKHAAAQAKLFASEAAVDATRTATQVFGGAGVIEGTAVSRFYRDAKILEIGEGTSEVQRLVIARGLGLPL
ncbi:MAG TPA: acyl-CoA dehydrogenase family protein [Acidimicrobiia bacterium]|nr:acyl-CoA dehydrogenase family protein [Acidimicrobiia bacterium]